MANNKLPVVYRVRNNRTGTYLNSNGVWGSLGRIFEKQGSAQKHLTRYSRTPKRQRDTDTGRILNCSDEWIDVEVVASKLVDISEEDIDKMYQDLYNKSQKEKK